MAGTPANADNINASAGVMSWDGVATINTSAITQYDILVGGASNAIVSVTPNTSGYILTSNGTSANPSFQVLPSTLAISYVAIQTITANGPYTPTSGMKYCVVEVLGGGGGGGGAASTNASQQSSGSGGGAGEFAKGVFSASTIGVSQNIIIGVGGAGNSGTAGSNGGATSFGVILSAFGGIGGSSQITTTIGNAAGGLGGTGGSGGNLRSAGAAGSYGYTTTAANATLLNGGAGANSQYGAGGLQNLSTTAGGANGNSALGYGAGGSGAENWVSQAAHTGGTGTSGIAIVTEYI